MSTSLHLDHSRRWHENRFVYPVLSRRSRGISIGVNLNPDKVCNFDCIYCQVDRRSESVTRFVETEELFAELEQMLALVMSGALYDDPKFSDVPAELRRLNDIAFSGDGEPTTYRNFDEIVERCAELKTAAGAHDTKLVLITNASMFHREETRRALAVFDANNGEIWAKLDAGTAAYFQLIDRTKIPFSRILDNIRDAAVARPLVIQSLFMQVDCVGPSDDELLAYAERLNEIVTAGGRIRLVQIYTVARRPAEEYVTALSDADVDRIVADVQTRTGLDVTGYYGR